MGYAIIISPSDLDTAHFEVETSELSQQFIPFSLSAQWYDTPGMIAVNILILKGEESGVHSIRWSLEILNLTRQTWYEPPVLMVGNIP